MVLDLEAGKIEIALGKFSFSPSDTIEERPEGHPEPGCEIISRTWNE